MPKPFYSLLLDVVENRCCSNHFPDLGVLDLIASGFDGYPYTLHLAGGDLSLETFGKGPCLTLVGQGWSKYGLGEFGFDLDGDVGVSKEWGKLVADVVGPLNSR